MNFSVFDKDTLLDLTVNFVPLFIIAFFIVVFLLFNPWGTQNLLEYTISHLLMVFTFLALAALTYVAGVKIEGSE